MRAQAIMAILCTMPLAAWSAQAVHVTLHTVPEGASITESGTLIGVTPLSLTYNDPSITTAFEAGHCVSVKPLLATWAGGAQLLADGQLCPAYGYDQQATIVRPVGQTGSTADAIVAAQAAANAEAARLARQAETDRIADNNAAMVSNSIINASNSYNQALQQRQYAYPQPYPPPSAPVTCTTSVFFGQLKTVCH